MNSGIGGLSGIGISNSQTPEFWPIVDGTVVKENPLYRGAQVPAVFGYSMHTFHLPLNHTLKANTSKLQDQQEGNLDAITKYPSAKLIANLTAADYKAFLQGDFGPAAQMIEKYYPLSLFESAVKKLGLTAGSGVLEAIAQVLTDAHFKCPTYHSAMHTARNGNPVWAYEFTHNSTCAWLDTLVPIADDLSVMGAAHTAEIPFVFGNLNFSYPNEHYTCSGSQAEWDLSKEMISLWTAMAEDGNPSTEAIQWPTFQITSTGSNTPGMIFGNSSTPGQIDFSVCKLWAQVSAMLDGRNTTATAQTPSSSSAKPTASPTSSFSTSDGVTSSPSIGGSIFLSTVLMGAAILI